MNSQNFPFQKRNMSDGMKWADLDSDDSDDEVLNVEIQHAGLNDGTVQAPSAIYSGPTVEESQNLSVADNDLNNYIVESDEESSDEDNEASTVALRRAREAKRLKELAESEKDKLTTRNLTKKERQALKEKEMDDLDSLLNEFGLSKEESKSNEAATNQNSKRKKKKKKKKDSSTSMNDADEPNTTLLPASIPKENQTQQVNVASILKAKAKSTKKVNIAAASAAKEAKAKNANGKKDKKKKKDKYAHGAPTR